MMKFTRMLPALLTRTDVVLEIRDSRLPLTSINRTLEGAVLFLLALVPALAEHIDFLQEHCGNGDLSVVGTRRIQLGAS